jgi:hypothetical protein
LTRAGAKAEALLGSSNQRNSYRHSEKSSAEHKSTSLRGSQSEFWVNTFPPANQLGVYPSQPNAFTSPKPPRPTQSSLLSEEGVGKVKAPIQASDAKQSNAVNATEAAIIHDPMFVEILSRALRPNPPQFSSSADNVQEVDRVNTLARGIRSTLLSEAKAGISVESDSDSDEEYADHTFMPRSSYFKGKSAANAGAGPAETNAVSRTRTLESKYTTGRDVSSDSSDDEDAADPSGQLSQSYQRAQQRAAASVGGPVSADDISSDRQGRADSVPVSDAKYEQARKSLKTVSERLSRASTV